MPTMLPVLIVVWANTVDESSSAKMASKGNDQPSRAVQGLGELEAQHRPPSLNCSSNAAHGIPEVQSIRPDRTTAGGVLRLALENSVCIGIQVMQLASQPWRSAEVFAYPPLSSRAYMCPGTTGGEEVRQRS